MKEARRHSVPSISKLRRIVGLVAMKMNSTPYQRCRARARKTLNGSQPPLLAIGWSMPPQLSIKLISKVASGLAHGRGQISTFFLRILESARLLTVMGILPTESSSITSVAQSMLRLKKLRFSPSSTAAVPQKVGD